MSRSARPAARHPATALLLFALFIHCNLPIHPAPATSATTTTGLATEGTESASGPLSTATTATPTSVTGEPTSTDSSSGCGFLCRDLPPGPPLCDPFEQECPEGQKCNPASTDGDGGWDANICVPVVRDPDQLGEPCSAEGVSGIDSCDKGLMCWEVDMNGLGTCIALCTGSVREPICPPDSLCYSNSILNLCIAKCDPFDPNTCSGELCLPNPQGEPGYSCILDASGDGGQLDAPCAYANGCDPGLLCVAVDLSMKCDQRAPGCCQPYCDKTQPPGPPCDLGGGQLCLNIYAEGEDPPGYEHVGVCGIP